MTEGDRRVLLALFGALLVALAARLLLTERARAIHGPVRFAVGADAVHLHVDGELWRMAPDGTLLEVRALAELGIGPKLSEMQVAADGALLLGDLATGAIVRCDQRASRCAPLALASPPTWSEHFGFHHDVARGLTYVADTHDHRLYVDDGARRHAVASNFEFPNSVHLDADGVLRVVDTNNHRVVAFAPGAQPRELTDETLDVGVGPDGRFRNPIAHARDGAGRSWVLVGRADLARGYLVVFDDEGREIELEVPRTRRPVALAWSGDSMLVADMDSFELHAARLGDVAGSGAFRPFGDAAVVQRLAAARARKAEALAWSRFALWATVAAAAALLAMALVMQRREQAAIGKQVAEHVPARDGRAVWEPALPVPGVTWARWDPASFARRSAARVVTALALAAVAGLGLYLYAVARYTGGEASVASFRAALLAVGLHFAFDALDLLRASRARIGTDGRHLVVERRGPPLRVPFDQVRHDDGLLLAAGHAVRLGPPGARWFEAASYAALVGDRLDPTRRMTPWRRRFELLRALDPSTSFGLLSLGLLGWSLVARVIEMAAR